MILRICTGLVNETLMSSSSSESLTKHGSSSSRRVNGLKIPEERSGQNQCDCSDIRKVIVFEVLTSSIPWNSCIERLTSIDVLIEIPSIFRKLVKQNTVND